MDKNYFFLRPGTPYLCINTWNFTQNLVNFEILFFSVTIPASMLSSLGTIVLSWWRMNIFIRHLLLQLGYDSQQSSFPDMVTYLLNRQERIRHLFGINLCGKHAINMTRQESFLHRRLELKQDTRYRRQCSAESHLKIIPP